MKGNKTTLQAVFDENFYFEKYGIKKGAFEHYCSQGWRSGFDPNPAFSVSYFLKKNPQCTGEPLSFLADNWDECDFISPVFDLKGYLLLYADVALSKDNPFFHFLLHGRREGRAPGFSFHTIFDRLVSYPRFNWQCAGSYVGLDLSCVSKDFCFAYSRLVDEGYYIENYGDRLGSLTPVEHYTMVGWREGFWPNPFFDPQWYRESACFYDGNPLWHHLTSGSRPAPFFCAKSYKAANPDVTDLKFGFAHFVHNGYAEKRRLGFSVEILDALRRVNHSYDWIRLSAYTAANVTASGCCHNVCEDGLHMPSPRGTADLISLMAVNGKIHGKRLVSFDIWDTVLRRDCSPDEVKLFASCTLHRCLKKLGLGGNASPSDLFRLRQLAEYRVGDSWHEYKYLEMLTEWFALAGVQDVTQIETLAGEVSRSEVAREIEVTRVDVTAHRMLNEVFGRLKIVAISDFYMSTGELRRILAHHGVERFFSEVYVSCESMKTKREGSLFRLVMESESLRAGDILHIGDNPEADSNSPSRLGIDSFSFVDSLEVERRRVFDRLLSGYLKGDGMLTAHHALGRLESALEIPVIEAGALANSGPTGSEGGYFDGVCSEDLLALALGGLGLFVLEHAVSSNVEKVFFATREGMFIKDIYDVLAGSDVLKTGRYPESCVLEVSRLSTFAASLREVSTSEMMRIWSLYSSQSMMSLCRSLAVDEAEFQSHCAKFGIIFDEVIVYPWQDLRVIALFESRAFRDWLSAEVSAKRESLWSYLDGVGFQPGASVHRLFVDIGWRGSIQDNIGFIINGSLTGVYLALYKRLAAEPSGSKKIGFLVDHSIEDSDFHVGDFAALEFVCNGLGGSVRGYGPGGPIRDLVPEEEEFIRSEILPIQARILDGVRELIPLFARFPLTGSDWRAACRESVRRFVEVPDEGVASAFQRLAHNETFGVGRFEKIEQRLSEGQLGLHGAELHSFLTKQMSQVRWPQAWLASGVGGRALMSCDLGRRLMFPRVKGLGVSGTATRMRGIRVSIFAPEPIRGSGGHRTIYNFARALDDAGFTVGLFSEKRGTDYSYKTEQLEGTGVALHDEWFSGVVPDVAIATVNYSAPYVNKYFGDEVKKFYFVQDFEAWFNPLSDGFVRGENSLAGGHSHLCIGRWLTHVLRTQYGRGAVGAGLGVDTSVYFPDSSVQRGKRIAVLYQPDKWRRLPEHCIEALAKVKAMRPDAEIVLYGSASAPVASFPFRHLGLVNDLSLLNKLYNSSEVGLCISLTNPSRIPYEMMAAGCIPVDVFRYNNLFDYENGTALLAWQTADSIAGAILSLLDESEDTEKRRAKCIEQAAFRTLKWETDSLVNAVEYVAQGGNLDVLPTPSPSYQDNAFVCPSDLNSSVGAWCDWQRMLATFGVSTSAKE